MYLLLFGTSYILEGISHSLKFELELAFVPSSVDRSPASRQFWGVG